MRISLIKFKRAVYTAIIIVPFLGLGCSDEKNPTNPVPQPNSPVDYYVSAIIGSNYNNGSQDSPFRTITHALGVARAGDSIKVMPGTYDLALGEIFPLVIPDSVTLIGDEDNRGTGIDSTVIAGFGKVNNLYYAAVVGGEKASLSGFLILVQSTELFRYCIYCLGVDFSIYRNTCNSLFGGVYLEGEGSYIINDNILTSINAGIWYNASGLSVVRDNQFKAGTFIYSYHGNVRIIHNTFTGNSPLAILVQNDSPVIDSNYFVATYSNAALSIGASAEPTIRRNNFFIGANPCILIRENAVPDIGRAEDSGYNVFGGVSNLAIRHEGTGKIYAIGNDWYGGSPECGTEIVVAGDGTVVWGTNPGDSCTAPETGEFEVDANTVALWHFNEGSGTTTYDATGSGHDASLGLSGAGEPSWNAEGRFGYGLTFEDTQEDFVLATAKGNDFPSNQVSVELWFKTTSADEYVHLFRCGDILALEMTATGITFSVGNGTSWKSLSAYVLPALTDNTWHYVACTFNGTTLNIFVDGVNRNIDLNAAITLGSPVSYFMGGYIGAKYFDGSMDEIRLSNIARSSSEISAYYARAQGGK